MSPHSPLVRPFGRTDVAAPTGSEAAAFDREASTSRRIPERVLMESAGRASALIVHRLYPRGPVVVLVGSGNNGGDAVVTGRTLHGWGREVSLLQVGSDPDGGLLHGWPLQIARPGGPQEIPLPASDSVIVDGILGTGLSGAPREPAQAWIDWANRAAAPIVALDVPSGTSAEDGAVPGRATQAAATVAFGWPKLGTLLFPARQHAGRLIAVEIGFPPAPDGFAARVITPGWFGRHLPRRDPNTHKYAVGALLLVAGSAGMAGAAIMAGRAALRAGVGILRIASVPEVRDVLQESLPEAIFVDRTDSNALEQASARSSALALGPGLGVDESAARLVRHLLTVDALPTVIDADGLSLIARDAADLYSRLADRPTLLTPHVGEMSRLSGEGADEIRADRPGACGRLADRVGSAVLLKGNPTLIAQAGSPLLVGGLGSSDLAVGGMGDVLTGVCGAILAQGAPPRIAGGLALHVTGRAAARAGLGPALMPTDVVDGIPAAMAEKGDGDTELNFPFVTFDQDAPR